MISERRRTPAFSASSVVLVIINQPVLSYNRVTVWLVRGEERLNSVPLQWPWWSWNNQCPNIRQVHSIISEQGRETPEFSASFVALVIINQPVLSYNRVTVWLASSEERLHFLQYLFSSHVSHEPVPCFNTKIVKNYQTIYSEVVRFTDYQNPQNKLDWKAKYLNYQQLCTAAGSTGDLVFGKGSSPFRAFQQ